MSTTDDAEFAPRSAARAERAPAGPPLGAGLGLGLDDAPEPVPSLLPPVPLPSDGEGPLPRRGHPGDPGFAVSGPSAGASVWQRAEAAWRAAGAEWYPSPDYSAPTTMASPASGDTAAPPVTPAPPVTQPRTQPPGPRRGRRRLLLTAVVLVLAVAVAWAGWERFGPIQLGPRSYPAAQAADAQFAAGPNDAGQGVFQTLTRVASVGNTAVAVGSQVGGDLTRSQFFVSADAGNTWQLAPTRAPDGGEPAPGHPAQFLAGGAGGWLAVGPHAIWTSANGTSWTLARTTGITPTDSGDQVGVLTRTATGWLAAGQNPVEATGVIWTSRDGLHWTRVAAAQAQLPVTDGTVVSITGAAARGPDIVLTGQVSGWSEEAGPRTTVTWLSTDSGRTWRAGSVPTGHGGGPGLAGVAATGTGFIAVRPGTAPSGSSRQARPAGVVYASATGVTWHYVTSLTSANGIRISVVRGGASGFAVLGAGPGGTMYGYASADGSHWKTATSFGPAPQTMTGTTVTASGAQIATGTSGSLVAERPYLAVAAPGHTTRTISFGNIAGATATSTGVNGIAGSGPGSGSPAGQRQVAVGESGGTLAVWSRAGNGSFTPGTWATVTGAAPAVDGTQQLDSVADGPAGWLATGTALAGTTLHPVVASSSDGRVWRPDQVAGLTQARASAAAAAANGSGYVIVGSATTSAGTFPAAWSSPGLRTWTRTAGPAPSQAASGQAASGQAASSTAGRATDPGQMLAVAAGTTSFVAVGGLGIDPATWTSADGRHWTAHRLKIPGTGARAQLSRVAVKGRTVVAFGDEVWASGAHAAFAEVSHDGGLAWLPITFRSPGGVATVTAVTAMSGGFTVAGTYGPDSDRDVAVWTSANGDHWRVQTPRGAGLSGPGFQQVNGLTATGSALTGVGYTATSTTGHPTLWPVPSR